MTREPVDDARARRRRRRRADARDEILEAAWEIADAEGIGAVALSEVARRVGMRAPSLYNYFPSKSAIVDAMFHQGAEEFRTTMTEPFDVRGRQAMVRALAFRFLDFALARPARFELLFHRPVPGFFERRLEAVAHEARVVGDHDGLGRYRTSRHLVKVSESCMKSGSGCVARRSQVSL